MAQAVKISFEYADADFRDLKNRRRRAISGFTIS